MCEWCIRFHSTLHSLNWIRHLNKWGDKFKDRPKSNRGKIIYIKHNPHKPVWGDMYYFALPKNSLENSLLERERKNG